MSFSLANSIASDYAYIDDLQAVTYYSRLTDTTFDDAETVSNVLKRNFPAGIIGIGGGEVATVDCVFHVWANQIDATPKVRDELVDASNTRFVVVGVDTQSLVTRYRLMCQISRV